MTINVSLGDLPQQAGGSHGQNNPFTNGNYSSSDVQAETSFPYMPTQVSQQVLRKFPYKTSNRILDDMRFTPALSTARSLQKTALASLLNSRPIEYAQILLLTLAKIDHHCLILNCDLPQAPPVSRTEHSAEQMAVVDIRGLLVNTERDQISHFRVQLLESLASPSQRDKRQFHVMSKDLVSVDDLALLKQPTIASKNLLDDAFFKDMSSNCIMRVSVYSSEFDNTALDRFKTDGAIKSWFASQEHVGDAPAPPSPVKCFQTLLKVLKGPLLMSPDDIRHTIGKQKTNLDQKTDISFLFEYLSFTLGDDGDQMVPPDLFSDPILRESYIRMSTELIFVAKTLKCKGPNDFDVKYSFSDTLSRVYTALCEVDQHNSISMLRGDSSNKNPDYIVLSSYAYFQDELVIRCYENTVNSDPENKALYVDAFRNLVSQRPYGGKLLAYYYNQHSKGEMYGMLDYDTALRNLGIQGVEYSTAVEEDFIVAMYKNCCREDPKNYPYFNKQLRTITAIKRSPLIADFLTTEIVPMTIALTELRIEEITEDEVVVTAYEFRLDEVMQSVNFNSESQEIAFLQKCLLSIAINRRSYILMSYVDKHLPHLLQQTPIPDDSWALLDVNPSSPDFDIISKFQKKVTSLQIDDTQNYRLLRQALREVANSTNSEILHSFLATGKVDPSLLPVENWPTGLDNIGNTCYLNSLLQYYFSIQPLRDAILQFDERNMDYTIMQDRKIGGRSVELAEINRSIQFIYRLQQLFHEMIVTNKRYILPSKELAYLSFLPLSQPVVFQDGNDRDIEVLSSSEEVLEKIEGMDSNALAKEVIEQSLEPFSTQGSVESQPEVTCTEVDAAENKAPVEEQTKIMGIEQDQIESAIEIGRQQDVTECIENVTFQIETAMQPEKLDADDEQLDLIKKLFSGKIKQTITPLESAAAPRETFERFFSLIINVGDNPKDIYDALDNFFGENVVALEEGKLKMSATLCEIPEILQFHVQRVLFDRERLVAYKLLQVIPFGEKVYLDRYLDTKDADIIDRRREVFEWKSEMAKLEQEKLDLLNVNSQSSLSTLDCLGSTVRYLKSRVQDNADLSISQETIDSIQAQIDVLKIRLQCIDTRVQTLSQKITLQFSSYQNVGYSLFAIFIHRGEASYGHYWLYIKDFKRNIFRKYNDDTVSEVPVSEVLNFTENNQATPYYVVYVKEAHEHYIEPLKREIRC